MKINRFLRNENGSIIVWTAIMLAVLLAFAGFATDIPYLFVARQQAQTAADAGAIAGAYELLTDPDDPAGVSTQAKSFASKTPIIGKTLLDGEIEVFTCNSNGGTIPACTGNTADPDQVTTVTYRWTEQHGNRPMPLFVLPVLQIFGLGEATANSWGWNAANIKATATARILNTCSSDCFKPWSIPDKWAENSVPPNTQFDPGIDTYDAATTGYQWPRDNGIQAVLKIGKPQDALTPGFFYACNFPPINRGDPISGAKPYKENIAACGPESFVAIGDVLQIEPGLMVGPTKDGVEALKALDPNATWEGGVGENGHVANSAFTHSPRLIRIAFFSPVLQVELKSGRGDIPVVNVGGFFLEDVANNGDVTGRFSDVFAWGGEIDPTCEGLKTVRLVQ